MSNWVADIAMMHSKFGVGRIVANLDKQKLTAYLQFRINFLQEELDELKEAQSPDDIVDALIDLCVIAIGTLDAFQVDSHKAWYEVLRANMAKEVGVNSKRSNLFELPDLIKPPGWVAPNHNDNVGLLVQLQQGGVNHANTDSTGR